MSTDEHVPAVEAELDGWPATEDASTDGFLGTPADASAGVPATTDHAEDSDDPDAVFSLQDRHLIRLLAEGRTQTEAGREIGWSERTVRRRKADPKFASRVAAVRAERLEVAASRLTGLSERAVAVLDEALDDSNPRVRLRAVEMVFGLGSAARHATDVEARIRVLEAVVEESTP